MCQRTHNLMSRDTRDSDVARYARSEDSTITGAAGSEGLPRNSNKAAAIRCGKPHQDLPRAGSLTGFNEAAAIRCGKPAREKTSLISTAFTTGCERCNCRTLLWSQSKEIPDRATRNLLIVKEHSICERFPGVTAPSQRSIQIGGNRNPSIRLWPSARRE